MALTSATTCFLNLLSSCHTKSSTNPRTESSFKPKAIQQVPRESEENWRKKSCVLNVSVACIVVVISLETITIDSDFAAIAREVSKTERWSERRICPPWRPNSLESIVPENLPRPAARRRWEAIGYSNSVKNAPSPLLTTKASKCFSL